MPTRDLLGGHWKQLDGPVNIVNKGAALKLDYTDFRNPGPMITFIPGGP